MTQIIRRNTRKKSVSVSNQIAAEDTPSPYSNISTPTTCSSVSDEAPSLNNDAFDILNQPTIIDQQPLTGKKKKTNTNPLVIFD